MYYGWGESGDNISLVIGFLIEMGAQILECVDSIMEKQGNVILVRGKQEFIIKSPSILRNIETRYHVIRFGQESEDVCEELEQMGYKRGKNYICITPEMISTYVAMKDIISTCDKLYETKKCFIEFIFIPHTDDILDRSKLENALCCFDDLVKDRISYLKSNPPYIEQAHRELSYYSEKYIDNIFTGKNPYRSSRGDIVQEEHVSSYVNVVNGMRVTTDQPTFFGQKVHVFGASQVYGFGVEDRFTLASCLQRKINKNRPNSYKVLNYGVRGLPLYEYKKKLESAQIEDVDVILCVFSRCASISRRLYREFREVFLGHAVELFDLSEYFYRPHMYGEIYFDSNHLNYKGYIAIADIIFRTLFDKKKNADIFITDKMKCSKKVEKIVSNSQEFMLYLESLDE